MYSMDSQHLNNLEKKIDRIYIILEKIEARIQQIESTLNISTAKMDNHIDFVENVYDVVRNPFSKLLSYYYGNSSKIQLIELKK